MNAIHLDGQTLEEFTARLGHDRIKHLTNVQTFDNFFLKKEVSNGWN